MRYRITFAKTEAMRFTGHLDLHRAWERAFRRARLPLTYSQGFSPHPRLNLAAALPLGFTSEYELLDAWLNEELPCEAVSRALSQALPPGMRVLSIETADERLPSLQADAHAADFEITFLDPFPELEARRQELLQSDHLPRRRRDKDYDLRPLVLVLDPLPPDENQHPRLLARLLAEEGATGRPEEVISVLGADPLAARVHRTRIWFKSQQPVS